MPGNPLVSVIMNCLNAEKYLREAIDSVYAQTCKNWEIIFWDNASTDQSVTIAKSYDDRLKYYRGESTIPLGAARNKALEKATGEFIAFLDCDDLWMPEKLSTQLKLFSDPEVGLTYSDTLFFNEVGQEQSFHKRHHPCRGRCFKELLEGYCISLEAAIFRKTILNSLVEWFDPRFNLIEEYDLFLRISHDWKVDYVKRPLSKWRVHSNSWTWKNTEKFVTETELMFDKYRSLFKEFKCSHSPESQTLQKNIAFQRAKLAWSNGNSKAARKHLRTHIFRSCRTFFFYFATFFNKTLVYRTARLIGFSVFPNHQQT